MTSTTLSEKQLNFARFSIVCVNIIKLPLIDILNIYIQPAHLCKHIKGCRSLLAGKYKLNQDQITKCSYYSSNSPDYNTFDVTLLYKLIRNLCPSLEPTLEPTNKWGNKPTRNDLSIGDDIERIRELRNATFAHTKSAEISKDDFKELWKDAKYLIQRCQQFTTNKGCKTDYNQMIVDLERKTFTFDEYISCRERSGAIYILGDPRVLCGDTARFEVEITLEQDADLPVSWDRVDRLFREQLDIKSEKHKGSNSRQLFIHCVCKEDEAVYQAVITRNQDVKIFSNEVYLSPYGEPPRLEELNVTSQKEEIYIHYVLNVLEDSPKVKEIRWTKNSLTLDLSNNKYSRTKLEDKCITISSPDEEDKGEYTCIVSNAAGSDSKSVKLDIPSAKILSTTQVVSGSDAKLDCLVSGHPPPNKVKWQNSLDGTTFNPIDIYKDKYFGSSTDPCSPFLLVRKATLNDQQYYQVDVWNAIGKCTSNRVFLQVTGDRPNMSDGTCTLQGHSVKLRCDVFLYDDSPALTDVYWTKGGIKLDIATHEGKYLGVNLTDPSLTINNVNYNDAGDYQLIAVNAVGETRSEVIVLGVPEVRLEKYEKKEDGSLWFTMTIKSVPAPHTVKWNIKENDSENFQPINVNAVEYKGTTNNLPHPVLVIKHSEKLNNCSFEIEVKNRIGEGNLMIPGKISQDIQEKKQKTIGKFHTDGGARVPFTKLLNELAEEFPKEKNRQLKNLIQLSYEIKEDNKEELNKANTALDCFMILWKEEIITLSDVIAMQFLLKETKCEELEKKCVEYAKNRKALYYYEKPPENGFKNVRFHVDATLHHFTTEDEAKIKETVANIVGCSIEDVRVNGYLHSSSFFIVLSIKEIYIEKLLNIKQHDKDKLSKLNIDYFKDDFHTVSLKGTTEVKDEVKVMFDNAKGSTESSKEYCIVDKGQKKSKATEWRGRDVLFGSRIRLRDLDIYGCVGFLVKSNVTSAVPVTGFLTAAHTVIKELKQLYAEKSMLSEYKRKPHCMMAKEAQVVVQYTYLETNTPEPVGEVVEAFFGNYKPPGSDCAFGMDVAFVKSFNPYMGEIRPISTVDYSTLTFDGTTVVIKRNRLTGNTYGVLISDGMSTADNSFPLSEQNVLFNNCFGVRSIFKDKPFIVDGESGSAVYVKGKNNILMPLGIAFARRQDEVALVCRIDKIIQAFSVSIYQEEEEGDM